MHSQPYPTRPTPEPALHLLGGIWIASLSRPAAGS